MKRKERNILYSRNKAEKIVFALVFGIFALYAASYLYVLLWTVMSSLKSNREFFSSPFALPQNWLFKNYLDSFKMLEYNGTNYFGMLFNSLWFTFGGLIISLIVSACTAYVLAKYKFRGSQAIYATALFIMIIPIMGSLPANYKLMSDLGLRNSPLFLITFTGGFGFNFFILHSYFRNLPWSYAEAAFIDGGGHFLVFFRIMIPLALGPVVTLFVVAFVQNWNDYMTMILYLPSYPTLASGLYTFQANSQRLVNWPVYYAGLLISLIPVLVLFAFCSDIMMRNMNVGGIKA